jgi:hypothetical protein
MPPRAKRGFWSRCRRTLRWFRFLSYAVILLVVGSLVYLNQVGLPEFAKNKLLAELRSNGVALQFERLRWRWFRGLVAEKVSLGRATAGERPELTVAEVALNLDALALLRSKLHVQSLLLRDGRLVVPLVSSNAPPQKFVVDDIQAELRLLPDDQWELDQFHALCLGTSIHLYGSLTNASAVRDWPLKRSTNEPAGLWQTQLRYADKLVQQMRFGQTPQIHLDIRGDASDLSSITADLRFNAVNAETEWGKLENLGLNAQFNRPTGTNRIGRTELELELEGASTSWGDARLARLFIRWEQAVTNATPAEVNWEFELTDVDTPRMRSPYARLAGRTIQSMDPRPLLHTELTLNAGRVDSEWARAQTNLLTAQFVHAPDSVLPLEADWQWQLAGLHTTQFDTRDAHFNGHLVKAQPGPPGSSPADPAPDWWAPIQPFHLDWEVDLDQVTVSNTRVDHVTFAGNWKAPEVVLEKINVRLYGRQADATAKINVDSREARAQGDFDFDVHQIASLLTPASQRWLSQYTWSEPPRVSAGLYVVLPAWTNRHPDWRGEVMPTLRIEGSMKARSAAFRGVPVDSASASFIFSNMTWRLPDFAADRPEGRVEFDYVSHSLTRDYSFKVRGSIDPMALKPLFEERQLKAFDAFEFTGPPRLQGEIRGRWREPEQTSFRAELTATNFTFRGQPVSELMASVHFTNRLFTATDVFLRSEDQQITSPGVGYDTRTHILFLTNTVGTIEPERVTRAIGPKTTRILSPYVFKRPPTARANGWVNVRDSNLADLRFEISGGPFNYWKFNVPRISGVVVWRDETVAITNLQADFYRGRLDAGLFFDFTGSTNAEFNFQARVNEADLHQLMSDLSSPTNRLEGVFGGNLVVTRGDTSDRQSWQGHGDIHLRDGYLWEFPLFGIVSPVLNTVLPGLGNSRVMGCTATFGLTNSVIHTDDMDIRSQAMRLAYRGTVDFRGNVDARVEARILRDTWLIGPIVSFVMTPLTKLFEYRVTGTLSQPQKEPLYIPRPIMSPFRTLKEIFSEEKPGIPPPKPDEKPEPP